MKSLQSMIGERLMLGILKQVTSFVKKWLSGTEDNPISNTHCRYEQL